LARGKGTELQIIIKALDKTGTGLSSAQSKVSAFATQMQAKVGAGATSATRAISDFVKSGIRGIGNLIKKVGMLSVALLGIAGLGLKAAWDWLVKPAMDAEALRVRLDELLGSEQKSAEMMDWMTSKAKEYGIAVEDIAEASNFFIQASKDAQGVVDVDLLQRYTMVAMQLKAMRPDVPIQKIGVALNNALSGNYQSLAMVMDIDKKLIKEVLGGLDEVGEAGTAATEKQLGRFTSVMTGGGGVQAQAGASIDALEELADKIGATTNLLESQGDTTKGLMNRIGEYFKELRVIIGTEFLEGLAKGLGKLIEFLEENEPQVKEWAKSFGEFLGTGLTQLVDFLINADWGGIAAQIKSVADTVMSLIQQFRDLPPWLQKLIVGGVALQATTGIPGKVGGGLLSMGIGAAAKGIGGLLGFGGAGAAAGAGTAAAGGAGAAAGTAAAGTAAGAGTAAAGGGTAAAAAGGLAALPATLAALGGVVTGGAVYEAGRGLLTPEQQARHPSLRRFAAVGAYGLGSMIGGKEQGEQWFTGVMGQTKEQLQAAQGINVVVTCDDPRFDAYVDERSSGHVAASWQQAAQHFGGR